MTGTVFLEWSWRKIVSLKEQIMPKDEYLSIYCTKWRLWCLLHFKFESMWKKFGHLYCKLQNKNDRNSTRESRLMFPLHQIEVSHLRLVFGGKRPDLHMPLQQKNEQTPTTWNIDLNLLKVLSLLFTDWGEVFSLP